MSLVNSVIRGSVKGPFSNPLSQVLLKVPGLFRYPWFCQRSLLNSVIHGFVVVQLLCVVFVKSSDKLLSYVMLDPEFIEVKMETMKLF